MTYTTLLQSVGDTRRPAIINVISVVTNIFFDPFLVLGIGPFPRLGVMGAALTDVMGKIISMIGQTYIIKKSYPELQITFTKEINAEWVRLVLRVGLPILSLGLMNGFCFLVQQRLVNMLGITVATAFSIGFVTMHIADSALFGLTTSTSIMVGQSLGAENRRRAREVALKSALLIFIVIATAAAAIYPFRRIMVDVFADDPGIIFEAEQYLQILLPSLPFFGLFINAMSIGRGSGHTTFPTIIDIARNWGVSVAMGYLLAFSFGMGSLGVWLAHSLSSVMCGTISFLWIKYGKWTEAIIKKNLI